MAEFNTYDILKQRYLVLTREALTALKEQVKHKPARRTARPPAAELQPAALDGELTHGHLASSPPVSSGPARCWNPTRWSSGP